MEQRLPNRWLMAAAGVVMNLALGAVYAWSVFSKPLSDQFHWTPKQVALTFSITLLALGFAAFFGGLLLPRIGPRFVAILGGLFYGVGVFLASFTSGSLVWLYVTYGLIGGIGLGLAYIVPVSTLVKWFPDRRGFITGVAVAGFGAGAVITAPAAQHLIAARGIRSTFAILGIAYLLMVVGTGLFMQNPPAGYAPPGWVLTAKQQGRSAQDFTLGEALRTWQWYELWLLLFLNVTAGISIISQASPMAQEITKVTAAQAAGVVGVISIFNGLGRFLWAWLSDAIGRRWVFLMMFLVQTVIFFIMPLVGALILFGILISLVELCYGGGFGTMPAFAVDYFGVRNVGTIYGLMLTAWGIGGYVGPLLIASLRQSTGNYNQALYIIAGIMLVSAIVPFIVRPPTHAHAVVNTTPNISNPSR